MARATVTRWENGSRRPSPIATFAIRTALEAQSAGASQALAGAALNQLWNNPEDAIYDDWRARYSTQRG